MGELQRDGVVKGVGGEVEGGEVGEGPERRGDGALEAVGG